MTQRNLSSLVATVAWVAAPIPPHMGTHNVFAAKKKLPCMTERRLPIQLRARLNLSVRDKLKNRFAHGRRARSTSNTF